MDKVIREYIEEFPDDVQIQLEEMYNIIKEVVPEETTEKITWRMPTFFLNGNLVHFAGFKNHIGLFPGARGIEVFKDKFGNYKSSKGGVQFPLNQELPKELIQEIVKFRVEENM